MKLNFVHFNFLQAKVHVCYSIPVSVSAGSYLTYVTKMVSLHQARIPMFLSPCVQL